MQGESHRKQNFTRTIADARRRANRAQRGLVQYRVAAASGDLGVEQPAVGGVFQYEYRFAFDAPGDRFGWVKTQRVVEPGLARFGGSAGRGAASRSRARAGLLVGIERIFKMRDDDNARSGRLRHGGVARIEGAGYIYQHARVKSGARDQCDDGFNPHDLKRYQ